MPKIIDQETKRRVLQSISEGLKHDVIAKKYNISKRSITRFKKQQDLFDELEDQIPLGHFVKKVTRNVDSEGRLKQQWIKTDRDLDHMRNIIAMTVDAMKDDVIPVAPVKRKTENSKNDLLSLYTITDYHLGMLACKAEAGEEWNLEIAEKVLIDWFDRAIKSTPESHTAVLSQLGDFLHYDGLKQITPSSGHILDTEAKFPMIVKCAIRVLRTVIHKLLEKHEHVHVIMAEGNHDLASSAWLRELFAVLYENDPRVTVDTSAIPYYAVEWGKVSLFFHHSHVRNLSALPKAFTAFFRDIFGRTKYSYGHTGHYHHRKVIEDSLMIMTQHQTLSARDSHAVRGAYFSERSATVTTYHKEYGEVSEFRIRPEITI